MSAKLKVGKTKSYFFTISLPDEGRELIFEVKALSENKAWEKLPMEVKKKIRRQEMVLYRQICY